MDTPTRPQRTSSSWKWKPRYWWWSAFVRGVDLHSEFYLLREAQVPAYRLPDPLVCLDGTPVNDASTWTARRRPEILEMFRIHVYGRSPPAHDPKAIQFDVVSNAGDALKGAATRKEVDIALTKDPTGLKMRLLVYLPNAALQKSSRCPVFLGLNFWGNHTVTSNLAPQTWPMSLDPPGSLLWPFVAPVPHSPSFFPKKSRLLYPITMSREHGRGS